MVAGMLFGFWFGASLCVVLAAGFSSLVAYVFAAVRVPCPPIFL
jgi:hypothetical protein